MVSTEYAKTIFEIHPNKKTLMEEFNCFIKFYDELNPVMQSPNIKKEAKHEIIKKSFKDFTDEFIYFIYVVIDNDRFNEIENIYKEVKKMIYKENNVALVDLYTKNDLTKEEKNNIVSFLKNKLNQDVELKITLDENIDGIKLIYNGNVLDYTISTRLGNMRFSL